ncbi:MULTISPECIES: hypothetical protein [Methylosinus]|uniref:Uncharacterized protein n=1 Tax=Methylosinus trichosporium (strain ATCC 35070 / NCIMB 11131 / UNIQEM 75 / OB3b) TaxID=595536 RepID=A0A2D2CW67_METT3|nr:MULTISPECIES: hypothetical protein [Methylosinus]ATQ66899.1 hypothetical protein CQW49_02545 [Methylosinus trichosporium OB3b]OBS54138.1 hypothetical protein A8B73_02595 [Methylosinus sp. 3S-1]
MTPIENLRPRVNAKHADLVDVFAGVANVFAAAATKKAELASSGRLTSAGVNAELQGWLAKGVLPQLRRAEKLVSDGRAALADRRKALSAPAIDRADTARAAHRQEARAYLRTLNAGQQAELLFKGDPLFAEAALELPALSGVQPDLIDKARAAFAARSAPDIMAQIDEREESLSALGAAVEMAKGNLRREVQPDGQSFDSWFAEAQ